MNGASNFQFSGTGKNATIVAVGTWPAGYSLNTTGQLVINANAPLLSSPLEYQICNLLGVCTTATISVNKENIPFQGNPDTFTWSGAGNYNILANDTYNNGAPGIGFVFSGSGQNASISPFGTWPTGFSINSSGQLVVAAGANMPTSDIYYNLCNATGFCQKIAVTFNGFTPGSIIAPANVCYSSPVTVNNVEKASSGLYAFTYKWQISYDNGTTWNYLTDDTDVQAWAGNQVTITAVESKILVRREATRLSIPQVFAYTPPVSIVPIKNEFTFNTGNSFSVALNGSVTLPTIQTTYPSVVKIYNSNNVEVAQGSVHTFSTLGYHSFMVKAERLDAPTCPVTTYITVNVYDIKDCTKTTEKVFATSQSWGSVPLLFIPLGGVANGANAVDGDMSTYSTVTVALGAVGLGTTWQNLNFGHKIDKGTPVTVKMGQEYSGAQVAGGITVYAVDQNNNPIGPMTAVGEGALLDLLVGDNVFEFKFIPKDSNGNTIDYYGVRVNAGSLLAVANNTKIFGAYYEKTKLVDGTCTSPDIIVSGAAVPASYTTPVKLNKSVADVLWGVEDIGLGVATSLSSVVYPYLAVDDNLDSYAIFNKSVAALNRQKLNVKLRQIARPGDEIRILMGGFEVPVLDLSLLTDFKVQRYLGNVKIGSEISGTGFKLLNLNLLALLGNVENRKALLISGINQPFDRVEITYLSTVQVGLLGDYTYIYDVSIMPRMVFDGQDSNSLNGVATKICAADYLRVAKSDVCTEYIVSFATATTDGQGNVTGFTEIPQSQVNKVHESDTFAYYQFSSMHQSYFGNLYLKVQVKRQGCTYGDPQYLKVEMENCNASFINPVLRDAVKKIMVFNNVVFGGEQFFVPFLFVFNGFSLIYIW